MEITKCGLITICGRPNVGKSTLINALVGEKIAIVSSKSQTTRNRITGVLNRNETQFVFMDTPGLHRPRNKLGEYMVKVVDSSINDIDAAILIVEPIANVGEQEKSLIERVKRYSIPTILVINKIDTLPKEDLLNVIAVYGKAYEFDAIIPMSARNGEGVEQLLNELDSMMPEGPQLFPEDMITDQPERQLCSEIIREKLLRCLDKEIPHGVAIEISHFKEREDGVAEIGATIYCEKSSHKGIIIGKGGAMLKKVSTQARQDMEKMLGCKVFLETWVKVKENWRDNIGAISNFGFRED